MKWLKYKLKVAEVNNEEIFIQKAMTYSEANLAIVEKEAYKGEYTIEEAGEQDGDV